MFLFKKKPKSFLGVDIGASAVKLVELKKQDQRYELKNYAIFSLEEYLKKNDYKVSSRSLKISNEEVAGIIKKSIKEAKIESKDAYFSIPICFSFSTLIDFPNMSEKEIAAAIPFEAKKYIPIPISEVVLDWSIVDSPVKKSEYQALLIAVPKKIVNNYKQIAILAGLNLKAMEEEVFSLARVLVGNDKSAIILIDAGARSISVSIIDDGYIRITHNLEIGGAKITQAIAQQVDLSLEKAEMLKKELSDKQLSNEITPQLKGSIQPSLGAIVIEIRKIIDSYQGKYNQKIEKCIFVGGGVWLSGFSDYLTEKLSLDVSIGDPFARIIHPPLLKPVLKKLGPALVVATGLAMRE